MRTRSLRLVSLLAMLLLMGSVAQAQSIKLVAPGVGWVAPGGKKILWTSDGGKDWKNVAPPTPNDLTISKILFLDSEHGWVLLAYDDYTVGANFEVARTDDGGTTWSMQPIEERFSGPMTLSFADPNHGCLGLLGASDGGRTWFSAYKPNTRKPEELTGCPDTQVTRDFGWTVAGRISDRLYVTRDAGKTWQQVVIP
ncbi:MAG: hypothetical protein IVW54_20610 [Candidatus Binataceae bacterium]|nr:hypothetical protein [Candidatus Binataceae bacterium]